MFDNGADIILERLDNAAEAVGTALEDALGKLAQKVEVNLAVLWERTRDDPAQVTARTEMVSCVEQILSQVLLWIEAEKLKRETDELSMKYLDEDVEMN